MNEVVQKHLTALQYGEPREFGSLAVVPLFFPEHDGPSYLSMKQAMDAQALIVTEVDAGGSVPELKVHNRSEMPVLLLDGEELVGAKQNRVLNTTVLLKEMRETLIPVSCTEAGRWSYVSHDFADSGVVMAASIRGKHKESVNYSLRERGRFDSDQGEVWRGISELASSANVDTPTSAMRDVFETRKADISEFLEAFPCQPNQQGMMVFVNGRIVGCDYVSLPAAYETLHTKLIKSYAMDAVAKGKKNAKNADYTAEAKKLIESAFPATEQRYASVGHGNDYRYESKGLVGSALLYQDCVIHAAFFAVESVSGDTTGPMASSRRRMQHRVF